MRGRRTILGLAALALACGTKNDAKAGEILPEHQLFQPLIADPRWPHLSAAYQNYGGDGGLRNVAAVSFGKDFSFYQWDALGGRMGVGLGAGVFAIFDLDAPSKDLVNADYMVGLPITFRRGEWQGMTRIYHQSSHLGDEYLLRVHPERVNLSYEGVELKLSRDVAGGVGRFYGGMGYLFDRDPPDLKPWTAQMGVEARAPWTINPSRMRPVAGLDIKAAQETDWARGISARLGVEIENRDNPDRRILFSLEYLHGRNPNGQFYEASASYWGLGVHAFF